ncbi:MAG: signal peptidase I [Puniceicoccaceae bacterium]
MFAKPGKKLRKRAGEYAEMARKIIHYRRDRLAEEALAELRSLHDEARELSGDRSLSLSRLDERAAAWEPVLRRHGGRIYPKTFWSDNIETFLVAAIIVLGIRAFFLQPFIIPTNSMYPTYSGMYHRIYDAEDRPSLLLKPLRFLFLGARSHEAVAESAGPARIQLVLDGSGTNARAAFEVVDARKWLVLPTKKKRYPIFIGNRPTSFEVPLDFDADQVLVERFFPGMESWSEVLRDRRGTGALRIENSRRAWIEAPGRTFQPGETVLSFDVLSGDALFVDRFSYHFFPPSTGDPIVFRTRGIEGMRGPDGAIEDKYYIKRLAGVGGEVLAIDPPALVIDGEVADGTEAFRKNAERIDGYEGYVNDGRGMKYLVPGTSYEVPPDQFFALGDNSGNSLDSRYWGSFHEKAVIGRALFIYYPFTRRWGPAE